ncbi:MAG TPA: Hpt domain-containing protein [Candidatus Sulfotelmatobacter sp.]|nr:Hpt domain-containing protein [Candidatus Sulfotelmatobacter sp.]
MSDAPIDLAHLGRYTAGDARLERELLDLFVRTAGDCLARLDAAPDARAWAEAAHGLRGAALGIGAARMAVLVARAEACGPGAAGREVLPALAAALAEVQAFAAGRPGREQSCR